MGACQRPIGATRAWVAPRRREITSFAQARDAYLPIAVRVHLEHCRHDLLLLAQKQLARAWRRVAQSDREAVLIDEIRSRACRGQWVVSWLAYCLLQYALTKVASAYRSSAPH